VLGPLRDLLDRKANMRLLAGVPLIAKLPLKEREVAFDLFATVRAKQTKKKLNRKLGAYLALCKLPPFDKDLYSDSLF
jgi:hypothetical protein